MIVDLLDPSAASRPVFDRRPGVLDQTRVRREDISAFADGCRS
jgi:hypothetical protein